MASTVESITAQLRELIDNANATTGNADDNVTDCMDALISGYGSGGGGSSSGMKNIDVTKFTKGFYFSVAKGD